MIDVRLLKYPEQLAAKLSKMEREIQELQNKVKKLEKNNG